MRRRAWLAGVLASGAAAWFGLARAQKPARVGYLGLSTRAAAPHTHGSFLEGMRELGYVEGRNLTVTWRFADGDHKRLPGLAKELVAMRPDVIIASVTPSAVAAKRATASVPIVFCISADPIGAGLVDSLARPGANATGTSAAVTDYAAKQLELLQRILPSISSVSLLTSTGNASHKAVVSSVRAAAQKNGLQTRVYEAASAGELDPAFAALGRDRARALIVPPDGLFIQQRGQMAELEAKHGIAAVYQSREHPEAGSLMSYGQDFRENFRLAATYVDRILRGAKPADLPVQQVNKLELVINARRAKALAIDLPGDVLLLADEVIQ